MKQIRTIVGLAIAILILTASCSKTFLDAKTTTDVTQATVFQDSAYTLAFLTSIYSKVGSSYLPGLYTDATDECDTRYTGGTQPAVRFAQGTLSSAPSILVGDMFYYSQCYKSIRQVNLFIANVDSSQFPPDLKIRTKAEARFLRAWYYFILMKTYGGVQIVSDTAYDINSTISLPRSSWSDCVEYVVKDCETAAKDLPVSYTGLEYGRATKGACLGLKSRLLLYAASPLFNGGSVATDPEVVALTAYPTYDATRWSRAAQAAKDVINMAQYQLNVDNATKPGYGFYNLFLQRQNSEYIFAGMLAPNKFYENNFYPLSRSSNDGHTLLQNVVDHFGMADGTPYNQSYDNSPYVNRDPRFYYSVVFNGSTLFGTGNVQVPVYTYVGATPASDAIDMNNTNSNNNTKSGYYGRKMCDTTTNGSGVSPAGGNVNTCQPLLRYAEIILNYAEALNESGNAVEAINQVILIRNRAGIKPGTNNMYGIPVGINQAALRTLIQGERTVELEFEGHRFFDVRRWKIAPQTETAEMQGMQITKMGTNAYTYQRFKLTRQHYWPANNNYYLMPIAQTEIAKLPNGVLLQNPGW